MSEQNNFIIAITGKSSSGKDAVARVLSSKGYKYVVSTTTRPMRSNEQNGVDYYFVNNSHFKGLMDNDKLVEYRSYNTINNGKPTVWHYGIERTEIDLNSSNYVCVVDLIGLQDLKDEYGSSVISFYIDVDDEKRQMRALARDRNFELAEWNRRLKDDEVKFKNVDKIIDKTVKNDDFDNCVNDIVKDIDYAKRLRTFYTQYSSY